MSGVSNLLERLELIKDLDPFTERLLNDCYNTITELSNKLNTLESKKNGKTRTR
jgi:hypothetical protein